MDASLPATPRFRYLYAVADNLPSWWEAPREGIDGAAVVRTEVEGLTLVSSRFASVPALTRRARYTHHDVVGTLLDARAIVPFPFGTVVPESQLLRWVSTRLPVIRASLRDVAGHVEMTVRLMRLDSTAERDRREGGSLLRALADRLVERAGLPHWRYQSADRGDVAASVAFLVPRGDLTEFLAHIAPVASRAEGLAVVPTGPSAPYSFTPPLDVDRVAARAG